MSKIYYINDIFYVYYRTFNFIKNDTNVIKILNKLER